MALQPKQIEFIDYELFYGTPLIITLSFGCKKIHLERFCPNNRGINVCTIYCDHNPIQYCTANVPNQTTLFPQAIWGKIVTFDNVGSTVRIDLNLPFPHKENEEYKNLLTRISIGFT